jgi:osmotically-inducible protein OsmY
MNDRFKNDRGRGGQSGWQGRATEPLYSSDEDETRGSEWTRDRSPRYAAHEGRYQQGGGYGPSGTYGQGRGYGGTQGGNLGAGSTRGDGQVAWGDPAVRPPGGYAGRGPKGYVRSDERIREDVCEYLSADDDVDASDIDVRVQDGEVTLEGTVETRSMKHHAENLADEVAGVKDVHNRLRVSKSMLNEIKDKLTGEESHHHYANSGTKAKPANGRLSG